MKTQMTKEKILTFLQCLAVLETIEEQKDGLGGVPESAVYMGLGMDYDRSAMIMHMLNGTEATKTKSHLICKGPKFEVMLQQLRAFEEKIKNFKKEGVSA